MAREFHINSSQEDENKQEVAAESGSKSEKRKSILIPIVIIVFALFFGIGGVVTAFILKGDSAGYKEANNGATLIQVDDSMTDEEIYKMLAEQATSMKVHVWQAPAINGDVLSLGFENNANNKYEQAFRVIQNDVTIYESLPVKPGQSVKDVECKDARVGKAVVEIFNVVEGTIYGNGVRCEVVIIGTDNDGNKADRVEDVTGASEEESTTEAQ